MHWKTTHAGRWDLWCGVSKYTMEPGTISQMDFINKKQEIPIEIVYDQPRLETRSYQQNAENVMQGNQTANHLLVQGYFRSRIFAGRVFPT